MKLAKSTTVLLNVVLVLLALLLVKWLIALPKNSYGQGEPAYHVTTLSGDHTDEAEQLSKLLNSRAEAGWSYRSNVGDYLIFER